MTLLRGLVATGLLGVLMVTGGCGIFKTKKWVSCNTPACALCQGTGTYECNGCSGTGSLGDCKRCLGQGLAIGSKCHTCHGSGKINCIDCDGVGRVGVGIRCDDCSGSGWVICSTCRGSTMANCRTCSGRGRIGCGPCKGEGRMRHGEWVIEK